MKTAIDRERDIHLLSQRSTCRIWLLMDFNETNEKYKTKTHINTWMGWMDGCLDERTDRWYKCVCVCACFFFLFVCYRITTVHKLNCFMFCALDYSLNAHLKCRYERAHVHIFFTQHIQIYTTLNTQVYTYTFINNTSWQTIIVHRCIFRLKFYETLLCIQNSHCSTCII